MVLGKKIIHSSSECIISTSLLFHLGKGFGLSVEPRMTRRCISVGRTSAWHTGDRGSIPGRDRPQPFKIDNDSFIVIGVRVTDPRM